MRALPPSGEYCNGISYAAPTDSDRGGTWIGVNEHGVTHCLLNAYENVHASASSPDSGFNGVRKPGGADAATHAMADRPSRGEIVRDVQCAVDLSQTREILTAKLESSWYPPFYLLRISRHGTVRFFWNGASLEEQPDVTPPVTTSSYRPEAVRNRRQQVFARIIGTPEDSHPTPQRLFRFHRTRDRRYPALGPCMSRSDAQTVSLTHISVRGSSTGSCLPDVRIGYVDGPPSILRSLPEPDRLRAGRLYPITPIDISRMFAERAPHIVRRLPPGTLTLLRPLLRLQLLNAGLRRLSTMDVASMFEYVLDRLGVGVRIEGREHLKGISRPVFACNHPSGGIEGMAMISTAIREFGDIALPANEILSRIVPLRPHIVPIDRYRGNAAIARTFSELFAGGRPVLVFPAGRTAREREGRLREYPWRKSFVTGARKHYRPIVPTWISGTNSRFFHRIYRIRTALNIDLNLEMFLLVRELFKRSGEELVIRFGPPVTADELVSEHTAGASDVAIANDIQYRVEHVLGSRGRPSQTNETPNPHPVSQPGCKRSL